MIRIGTVQTSSYETLFETLNRLRYFAALAKEAGCVALCFPECYLTGYAPEQAADKAIRRNCEELKTVTAIAKEYDIDLLVGFMERTNDIFHITHAIFRPDGTTAYYKKTHLGQKERLFFAAGDKLEVFPLSCGLQFGFQLCVETHFPDITQTLSLHGAELIFAPHAVPRVAGERQKIWNKFIPARSYDNRVYLVCCNHADGERFAGGCLVTGPDGEEVASFYEDTSHLLCFDVDTELLRHFRDTNDKLSARYYPAHRRPGLYHP